MLQKELIHQILTTNGISPASDLDIKAEKGGGISSCYSFEVKEQRLFLKLNNKEFLSNFQSEAKGLALLQRSDFIVPNVIAKGSLAKFSYLLMQYIERGMPDDKSWEMAGRNLAQMHSISTDKFGLNFDNYIGSLPQSNQSNSNWSDFYWNNRIMPLIESSKIYRFFNKKQLEQFDLLRNNLENVLDFNSPSLIHGDLWSGNIFFNEQSKPVLVDPAIYFGVGEVDIAMTKLFGQFPSSFYNAYFEINQARKGIKERISIYQLYPLLVHSILFGKSYFSQTADTLNSIIEQNSL